MKSTRILLTKNNIIRLICNFCFVILVICSVFCYSTKMTDTHILPKWLYSLSVLSVIGVFYGIAKFCRYKITLNVNFCHAVFLIVALLQVVYAYLQGVGVFHSYFAFKMVGSFDNPVGLATCACVGISSCLYLFRNAHSKLLRYILVLILILLCSMLFLSGSRAGILGGMLLLLYYIWCYILKKGVIRFLFIIAVIPMFIGMYFVKKDSADGRILILQCCWDMIKERPILGHGFGAFEAHYMDYQAAYFALHPNSHYSILADNVKHAFNEFIMILVEFGIVGFLCLLFIVFVLWLCYYRAPSWEREIAFLSMLSIAVIACFSFPLTYLLVSFLAFKKK